MNGLERAIKAAGTPSALARALGVTRQQVHKWKSIPVEPTNYVLKVEKLYQIQRHLLRPDIYPCED